VFYEKTKHLKIDSHLVLEKAQAYLMRLVSISSSHQLTKILTTALPPCLFKSNAFKLELIDLYISPT